MYLTATIAVAVLTSMAHAHNAPWHPAMFGFDYPSKSQWPTGKANYNSAEAKNPIRATDQRTTRGWLGNGMIDYPPAAGVYLELESGGELTPFSRWRNPNSKQPTSQYAGQGRGTLHAANELGPNPDISLFGGTALAIAYASDPHTVDPGAFTVISTNWASPWRSLATYPIPSGLPPCPPGGCLCTWNWIHQKDHGEGYGDEMYNVLFRCLVTGATDSGNVVPRGAVATQCDGEDAVGGSPLTNCTKGPKQPIIIFMAEGNTHTQPDLRGWPNPTYNWRYGFADGAQQDAVVRKGEEGDANGVGAVSRTPRPGSLAQGKGGLAVVNARGERLWPGELADEVAKTLAANGYVLGTANASTEGTVASSNTAQIPTTNTASAASSELTSVAANATVTGTIAPDATNVTTTANITTTDAAGASTNATATETASVSTGTNATVAATSESAIPTSGAESSALPIGTAGSQGGAAASSSVSGAASGSAAPASASGSGAPAASGSATPAASGSTPPAASGSAPPSASGSASGTAAGVSDAAASGSTSNYSKPSGRPKCARRRRRSRMH